jgi:hypothetical protein
MKSKLSVALIAMLTCLAFVGVAFAAGDVEVSTTGRAAPLNSECAAVGSIGFGYLEGVEITAGDVTEMILPLNVFVCRDIDMVIAPAGDVVLNDDDKVFALGTGYGSAGFGSNANDTAAYTKGSADGIVGAGEAADELIFHIYAAAGTAGANQKIYMDALGLADDDYLYADSTDEEIWVTMFNQQIGEVWLPSNNGADATYTSYGKAMTAAENTLCVNISQYSGSSVSLTLDSIDQDGQVPYVFAPNPATISTLLASSDVYSLVESATKGAAKKIELPAYTYPAPTQDDPEPDPTIDECGFDFDNYDAAELMCEDPDFQTVLTSTEGFLASKSYTLTLTIEVAGSTADGGVYFNTNALAYEFSNSSDPDDVGVPGSAATDASPELVDNAGTCDGAVLALSADSADCMDFDNCNRIGTLAFNIQPGTNRNYLHINIPAMVIDKAEATADETVSLKVYMGEAPCGKELVTTMTIGYLVEDCTQGGPIKKYKGTDLVYPYFIELANMTNGAWWAGVAFVNRLEEDTRFTAKIYDSNGNCGTWVTEVPNRQIWAALFTDFYDDITACDGTTWDGWGDYRFYVEARANGSDADGFAMMGALASDGTSMGYLPRAIPLQESFIPY